MAIWSQFKVCISINFLSYSFLFKINEFVHETLLLMLFRLVQSGNCEGITTAFKRTHIRINNSLDFLSPLDFALAATVASCAANPSQAKFRICTHNYVNMYIGILGPGSPTCWTADQSKPTRKLRFSRYRRYRYNGRLDFAQTWQIKRLSSCEWINKIIREYSFQIANVDQIRKNSPKIRKWKKWN